MARTKKTLRLRGSRTGGFGRKNGTGAGKNGGTGKAGSMTHNFLKYELEKRKKMKKRKSINLKGMEMKKDQLIKKKLLDFKGIVQGVETYTITSKFKRKYKKILGTGEISYKINPTKLIKLSKSAKSKNL